MNIDQQQQHRQQQQQQHHFPPPPSALHAHHGGSAATTPVAMTSLALSLPLPLSSPSSSSLPPPPPATTTYVTIGVLPPSSSSGSGSSSSTASASSAASTTTATSSFKTTPLLPMPTLEDIECGGGLGVAGAGVGNVGGHFGATEPPPPLPLAGILKYPTMSLSMGPLGGPPQPPPLLHHQPQPQPQPQSSSPSPSPPPPPPPCVLSTASTIGSSLAAAGGGHNSNGRNSNNNANLGLTTATSSMATSATTTSASATAAGGAGRRHKTKRKCCACFGGGGGGGGGGSGKKARKNKTQTLWAGLLTNLGISALLLAYTLLGSFIFLTIESEDSASLLHQQRTLASTKRVAGHAGAGGSGSGTSSSSSSSSSGGGRNIYHTQPHHLDNGTVAAVSSSSSSSSTFSSSSSSSSSSSLFPSSADGNPEFDMSDSQLALSADTYDVRQRTIENIWDITVSLNILYKENWTKLAALEIAKFQDQLVKRLNEDALLQLSQGGDVDVEAETDGDGDADGTGQANGNRPATEAVLLLSHQHGGRGHPGHHHSHHQPHEWNFAKAFLYSLTVLTTIGYGNIAPRTTLGRLVTLAYAMLGIPLTLIYLSSTGGILAKVAREVFSKALCCCLCSNCGYCCYDEKRMAEKERRMRRKRQQEELRKHQAAMQEPYYVRSGVGYHSPEKHAPTTPTLSVPPQPQPPPPDIDSLSASESRGSMHGLSILAPILLCLSMMIIYILFGAIVLYRLESWPLLDGIYFCFMSLSTIGFGDLVPGLRKESTTTTWFCSIYIMSGMALTAMCFNVIHEEIVHRIKIVVEFKKGSVGLDAMGEAEPGFYMAAPPPPPPP